MQAEPAGGRIPYAPCSTIHSTSCAPDICIVMRHPAPRAIHIARSLPAGHRQVFDQLQKWFVQFRQIRFLCRPVVHLCINVDRVLAIPGRSQPVIPDALQVGRLPARLRRRYQQVSSKLEIQRYQVWIIYRVEIFQSLVGRRFGGRRRTEIQFYPVEIFLVSRHVRRQYVAIRFWIGIVQVFQRTLVFRLPTHPGSCYSW